MAIKFFCYKMSKISAYIIAYNEADKIKSAINTVLWADEIILVDSFSTDGTADIAESMGARVVQVRFNGFGDLRNQAIKECSHEWIFSLDADERCTKEVRDEIFKLIQSDNSFDVYHVPRKNYFMGKWIKHSGFYPDYRQPQLFKNGALSYKQDQVHEGFLLHTKKPVGYLENPIWQVPFKKFEELLQKANKYSTLGAEKLYEENRSSGMITALSHALWTFILHFFIKKGFLDGWPGFIIAFGNFQGTFYKYAKLYEKQSNWRLPESNPIKKEN